MANPQDILRRRALEYHQIEDRGSSCGSMALDMDLILSGLVEIGSDARLYVTDAGRALLAQGMARDSAETEGLRPLRAAKPGSKDAPEHVPANSQGTTPCDPSPNSSQDRV